jgi:hypothetical protein
MTDRRPINKNVNVPKPGYGEQPCSRNQDGQIRDKRRDEGKSGDPFPDARQCPFNFNATRIFCLQACLESAS